MECPAVLCLLAIVVSATSLECPGGKCSSQSIISQSEESNGMISSEYDSLFDDTFGFLHIAGQELTGVDIVAELQRTSWMGPITSLKISECEISNLTTDTFDLIKDTLQQLSIVNGGFDSLAALPEFPHLKFLNLSHNYIGSFDVLPIKSLGDSLEVLDLSNNVLRGISTNLSLPNLRELNLSHNVLGSFDWSSVKSLADSLEVLDLSHNYLDGFSTDLAFVPNLRKLNLSHNQLESFDLILVKSLADSLEVLDMSYNKLDTISTNLAFLPNLRELNLSYNRISVIDDYSLNTLKKLEVLSLSHNILSDAQLTNLQNLKQLDVSWNWMRMAGDVLQLPSQRLSLRLDSNPWNCDCDLLKIRDNNDVLDLDSVQCDFVNTFSECFGSSYRGSPYLPCKNGQYLAVLTEESISVDGCPAPVEPEELAMAQQTLVVYIFTILFVFFVILTYCSLQSKKLPKRSWLITQIPDLKTSKADSKVHIPYIKVEEPQIKTHSLIRLL